MPLCSSPGQTLGLPSVTQFTPSETERSGQWGWRGEGRARVGGVRGPLSGPARPTTAPPGQGPGSPWERGASPGRRAVVLQAEGRALAPPGGQKAASPSLRSGPPRDPPFLGGETPGKGCPLSESCGSKCVLLRFADEGSGGPRTSPLLPRLGAEASSQPSVFIPSPSVGPLGGGLAIKEMTFWRPMISQERPVYPRAAPCQVACPGLASCMQKDETALTMPPAGQGAQGWAGL